MSGACGSSSSTPATPAPSPVPAGSATVSVTAFAAIVELTPTGAIYHVSFQVNETGGQTGATLSVVTFIFLDGFNTGSMVYALPSPVHVAGGGAVSLGPIAVNDTSGNVATQISANVSFTDDAGHAGLATGSGQMPVLKFGLAGSVQDITTGQAVAGAIVKVITGPNGGVSQVTDATGSYSFTALQAGTFTLQGQAAGYTLATQSVTLTANARVNLQLTPGS
jgi:hypothetical protein